MYRDSAIDGCTVVFSGSLLAIIAVILLYYFVFAPAEHEKLVKDVMEEYNCNREQAERKIHIMRETKGTTPVFIPVHY